MKYIYICLKLIKMSDLELKPFLTVVPVLLAKKSASVTWAGLETTVPPEQFLSASLSTASCRLLSYSHLEMTSLL